MGEAFAFLFLLAVVFAGGWFVGRRGVEQKLKGSVGTKAGRCGFCGTHIEGGNWDMAAHQRFYCRPPTASK
jgi:hypothetical protein